MSGMQQFEIYRDPALAKQLIRIVHEQAKRLGDKTIKLMEVCGTHTVSIARYGLRQSMPANIELISGPGCPVCVSAHADIDAIIALARIPNIIMTTFGDMMRVPGSSASLNQIKSEGYDVRIVYSPLDALELARTNPTRHVVFAAVGFETTAPIIGAALLQADAEHLENFSVVCVHKTMPHALEAIVNDQEVQLDGLILPGHVSTIIGLTPYQFLAQRYYLPGVVTGFEPVDVLQGIATLTEMVIDGTHEIRNAYPRGVQPEGNRVAQQIIDQVFEPSDALWRGMGCIAQSGLKINERYAHYDALKRFAPKLEPTREPKGCRCGDILRGVMPPYECKLFGRGCTPEHPVGPCMVSSEGSCAAYYRYQDIEALKRIRSSNR